MGNKRAVKNLQLITLLDSISYGMIYGFLSTHLIVLGGAHISIGVLAIGNLIAELFSPNVIKCFTHLKGKRFALFIILNIAFLTNLLIVMTYSVLFTILARVLYSLTNQTQNLCKELLVSRATDEETDAVLWNYSVFSGAGYIIGPIITGYIFDYGFGYAGLLAALLTLINVYLLLKVTKNEQDENPEHMDKSALTIAQEHVIENIDNLLKSDVENNWDCIALQYLFSGSILIFFSKFTQLVTYNYKGGSISMGYIGAFINLMVFIATYNVDLIQSLVAKHTLVDIIEKSFLIQAFLMLFACYAPFVDLYLLLLIATIFMRSFILTLWDDLFSERNNAYLIKVNGIPSIVAGSTVPILFGSLCNVIAHRAVILFSCVPMFLCWAIVNRYTRKLKISAD